MSIMAAQRMGLSCMSLDPGQITPASQIAPNLVGKLSDPESLSQLLTLCSIITFENEFVPASALEQACDTSGRPATVVRPGIKTLATIQDKLHQKEALMAKGVPCSPGVAIEDDGTQAIAKIGFPMVLKARFGGYDGKGTRYARDADEFEEHRTLWADGGWMAEKLVEFKRELAAMVFQGVGRGGVFPTVVSEQKNSVCDLVYPADVDASKVAIQAIQAVASEDGAGLFGVEMFETADGQILVNEIAPRPHNSGHYTMDWGGVSQFEQHVRCVMGLSPAPVDGVPTAMVNLFGIEGAQDWRLGLSSALGHDPGVAVHWYGKVETRPGRKMGHINAFGHDLVERVKASRDAFYKGWRGGDTEPPPDDFPG